MHRIFFYKYVSYTKSLYTFFIFWRNYEASENIRITYYKLNINNFNGYGYLILFFS